MVLKMEKYLLLVIIAFGVLSDAIEEPSCDQRRPEHCFAEDVGDISFPNSEEALNNLCPVMLPRFKCLVDFKNKCGLKYPGSFDQNLDTIYDIMVEACDKDSTLHKELSTHLPCIEKVMTSHHNTCKPLVKGSLEVITKELNIERNEKGNFDREEDMVKYYCLWEAFDVTCFVASTAVNCGNEARDLVGELVDRAGFLDVSCPEDIRDEIKEIVEDVQIRMTFQLAQDQLIAKFNESRNEA